MSGGGESSHSVGTPLPLKSPKVPQPPKLEPSLRLAIQWGRVDLLQELIGARLGGHRRVIELENDGSGDVRAASAPERSKDAPPPPLAELDEAVRRVALEDTQKARRRQGLPRRAAPSSARRARPRRLTKKFELPSFKI